ncbi:Beta-adaptin appendage, C-terminal subdomain containing protein [Trema orientale]|uniref:Beta-adaptin appendage, C-terminal subdomain containing protein n=1 Tax=Trema orientale TaxID=63057 RepID=A0A2P5EA63_TREOI|nr:Beta-adaptin appendage, C-terminal subdomain containing protein [Trema orientale]
MSNPILSYPAYQTKPTGIKSPEEESDPPHKREGNEQEQYGCESSYRQTDLAQNQDSVMIVVSYILMSCLNGLNSGWTHLEENPLFFPVALSKTVQNHDILLYLPKGFEGREEVLEGGVPAEATNKDLMAVYVTVGDVSDSVEDGRVLDSDVVYEVDQLVFGVRFEDSGQTLRVRLFKFFFFAQKAEEISIFLVECIISTSSSKAQFKIKTDDQSASQEFLSRSNQLCPNLVCHDHIQNDLSYKLRDKYPSEFFDKLIPFLYG